MSLDPKALGAQLFRALENRDTSLARQLIEKGADVNYIEGGITPLFFSVGYGFVDITRLLIQKGANLNQEETNQKITPLSIVKDLETARLLIERGANLNHRDIGGRTPLFLIRDPNIIELLIRSGAYVNEEDREGMTPIFYPVRENNLPVARVLIQNGADVNHQDGYGSTPLFNAFNVEMAQLLVENGADITIKNKKGRTALYSLEEDSPEVFDYLTKVLEQDKVPSGMTEWQYYCSLLNELKVTQLKELAREAGIVGYSTMLKAQLCQALKESYADFISKDKLKIKNDINCEKNNGKTLGLDEFNEINRYLVIRDNQGFCHYLPELETLLRTTNLHPFTRESLDKVYVGTQPIREVAMDRRELVDVHTLRT